MSLAPASPLRDRLDETVRRYYAPLLRFFRKHIRNSMEVQDLVQQVFLRLSQRPQVSDIENADGYMSQAAANALKDHFRRTRTRQRVIAGSLTDADTDGEISNLSPERVLQGQESIAQVVAALRELPERTRDIFVLRCFEGQKHADIARLQRISVRAVQKHLATALAHVSAAVDGTESRT
mgnify:CR=1 FL=1